MNHWPLSHPAFEKLTFWSRPGSCRQPWWLTLPLSTQPLHTAPGSSFPFSPSSAPSVLPKNLHCGQCRAHKELWGNSSPPSSIVSTKQGQLGVSAFSASLVSFFYPNCSSFSSAASVQRETRVPCDGDKPIKRHSTHKLSQSLTSCPSMANSGQANSKKEPLNACIRPVKCEFCLDCSTVNAQCLLPSGGRNLGIHKMYQWPEDTSSAWSCPAWPAENKNPAVSALLTRDSEQTKPLDSKDRIFVVFLFVTTR